MRQIFGPILRRFGVGFAFAMSVVTLTLLSSTQVSAFSGSGAGTSISPYQITTCAQLQSVNLDLAAYYTLESDIDCSAAGASWSPIGASGGFTGTLDGQHHKILNLDLSGFANSASFAGIFSTIKNTAVVQNLLILNGKINGGDNIGMVAGALENTATLDDVYVQAQVTCHADNCGGLVGSLRGASVINNSGADVSVISNYISAGGLVGWISDNGTIQQSFANGQVTGTLYVGGLVGAVNNSGSPATITDVYANATVVGDEYVGGLVGLGVKVDITNAYATGSVSGGDNVGGLVALFFGVMTETFAANTITSSGTTVGPVTGIFVGGTAGNRYFDTTTTGFASSPDGSSPITDSNYFRGNSSNVPMSTWNFSTVWRTNYGEYPSFAPKVDPYMLCEAPQSTNTTISGNCDVRPLGWGTPIWQARWRVHGTGGWHTVTLNDIHQAKADVDDLKPGTTYDLQFRYTNDFGTGPWGTVQITTTGTVPTKPSVRPDESSVPVSIPAPAIAEPASYEPSSPTVAEDSISTSKPAPEIENPAAEGEIPTSTAIENSNTKDTITSSSTAWYWLCCGALVLLIIGIIFGARSRTKE